MKISKVFFILLIILINIVFLWPLFKKGFIVSDDGDLMLIRLGATIRALRDGHFPIRILDLHHGYGYPVLNFLYPLPFYIGSFIYFVSGIGLINSYKASFLLYSIIGSLGVFFLAKNITKKNLPAFVCTIFYLVFPSRIISIFYRSAIGELLVISLLPFIFLLLNLYRQRKDKRLLLVFSLFLFLIIISHNVLALLTLGTIIIFNFFVYKDKSIYYYVFFGILLSSFFSLPAIFERSFTHSQNILLSNISDRLLSLKNLINNSFMFGRQNLSRIEDLFSFGLPALLVISISIFMFFRNKLKREEKFMIFYGLVLIFLTLNISKVLWQTILNPLVPFIQFPWRIFSIIAIVLTMLLARILAKVNKTYFSIIFLILIVAFGFNSWQLVRYKNVDDNFFFTNQSSSTTKDEFTPIWVKNFPKSRPPESIETNNSETKVSQTTIKTQKISFIINAPKETEVFINKHYYPGWTLFIDNKKEVVDIDRERGIMKFTVAQGQHKIILLFKETILRKISNTISLSALIFLFYGLFLGRKKI